MSKTLIDSVGLSMVATVVIALRIASEPTANLSYLVLAAYAMLGRGQAIQALALSWLITMINPGFSPEASFGSVGRYSVIIIAASSVFLRSGFLREGKVKPVVFGVLSLGLFFFIHSLLFSSMPDVSLLKAMSWTVVMMTLLSAWSGLEAVERARLAGRLYNGFVILALVSLPLLLFPAGFFRNGSGFQGVLNHPQAFGAAMALLGAWTFGRVLGKSKPSLFEVAIFGLCLVLIVLSETRTAGVGLVLGTLTATLIVPIVAGKKMNTVLPGIKSRRFQMLAVFGLVAAVVAGPALHGVVTDFITKSGRADVRGLIDAYGHSRAVLIDPMLANIEKTPIRGIGFGIGSHPELMEIQRDPLLGLPVGASIEKGIMPLAVLEEIGIPGAVLVILLIWTFLRRSVKAGMAPFTVVVTILYTNLGESVFFSPGGMGMLQLVLLAWAVSSTSAAQQPTIARQ